VHAHEERQQHRRLDAATSADVQARHRQETQTHLAVKGHFALSPNIGSIMNTAIQLTHHHAISKYRNAARGMPRTGEPDAAGDGDTRANRSQNPTSPALTPTASRPPACHTHKTVS